MVPFQLKGTLNGSKQPFPSHYCTRIPAAVTGLDTRPVFAVIVVAVVAGVARSSAVPAAACRFLWR